MPRFICHSPSVKHEGACGPKGGGGVRVGRKLQSLLLMLMLALSIASTCGVGVGGCGWMWVRKWAGWREGGRVGDERGGRGVCASISSSLCSCSTGPCSAADTVWLAFVGVRKRVRRERASCTMTSDRCRGEWWWRRSIQSFSRVVGTQLGRVSEGQQRLIRSNQS